MSLVIEFVVISCLLVGIIVLVSRLMHRYRQPIKTSNESWIHLNVWVGFVVIISAGSAIYDQAMPSYSLSTVFCIAMVILAQVCSLSDNNIAHLLFYGLVLSSWFPLVLQFLVTEPGHALENLFSACWIVPIICCTASLLLPIVRHDMSVDLVSDFELFLVVLLVVLVLVWGFEASIVYHFFSSYFPQLHRSLAQGNIVELASMSAMFAGIHTGYYGFTRFLIPLVHVDNVDNEPTGTPIRPTKLPTDRKKSTTPTKENESTPDDSDYQFGDRQSLPSDCVEITLEEAIRLTSGQGLKKRRNAAPTSMPEQEVVDSDEDEYDK